MTANPLWRPDPVYDQFWTILDGLSEAERNRNLSDYAPTDLYFFSKFICGFWWLCSGDYGPHLEFCREIEKDVHLSLFLLPRGHCKTKIFSIADTIRQYILDPYEPQLLVSEKMGRAANRLKEVKWLLERRPVFSELWPELFWSEPKRQASQWTGEAIILPGHQGQQEPSVRAAGIEAQPTGEHYKRIKVDDLVVPENTTTSEMIRKTKELYGLMRAAILRPDGNLQICGTIYDDGDLHMDMARSGQYRVYKRPALFTENNDGVSVKRALWPVQYDAATLDTIRRDPTVGEYIFSCQYLLDPVPDDKNAFFKMANIQRYPADRMPAQLKFYAATDFAISEGEEQTGDYTSIVVCGVSWDNGLYVVDVLREHMDAYGVAGAMIEMQSKWRPQMFGVEAGAIKKAIGPYLKSKMRSTGVFLNLQQMTPDKDKVSRARSIQGRISEGAVYLPERGPGEPPWQADFEHELRRFPRGKHDDQVDAMAYIGLMLDKQTRPRHFNERAQAMLNDRYQPLDATVGF